MKAKSKRTKALREIISNLDKTDDAAEVLRLAALASYQLQDICGLEQAKAENQNDSKQETK